MTTAIWVLGSVGLLLALVCACLWWRGFRTSGNRSFGWFVRRVVLAVLVVAFGFVGLRLLYTAVVIARSDQAGQIAMQERFCKQSNADCHPNVSRQQSAATLADFKRANEARLQALRGGDKDSIWPSYMQLPLLINDRVKADHYLENTQAEISAIQYPNEHISRFGDGLLPVTVAALAAVGLLYMMADSKESPWKGTQARNPAFMAKEREFQRLAKALDKYTTWDAFNGYMRRHRHRAFVISLIIIAITYVISLACASEEPVSDALDIMVFGFMFAALCTWVIKANAAQSFWPLYEDQEDPQRAALRAEAVAKGIKVNNFGVNWRPPQPTKAQGEHGSARHAAEDDLLAKGFAESDGPSDAEKSAGLSAMSQAERDAFAKKAGAVITRGADGTWHIREKGAAQ